jgi:hypothetical protein
MSSNLGNTVPEKPGNSIFLSYQIKRTITLHQLNVMAELITFMQVLGNLLLAAVILSALLFTTFYYVLGYVLKELKLAQLLKKGVHLRRRSY